MCEAVVFDFDGTLVDSYSRRSVAHKRVRDELAKFLERKNREYDDAVLLEEITRAERTSKETSRWNRDEWWKDILSEYGLTAPEEIVRRATMVYWETTLAESEIFPGIESMIKRLSGDDIPIGVISDTDGLEGMKDRRIAECDLAPYFDAVVVAGEDTEEPKPDTDPFRLIAAELDVSPDDCLYVGDNPHTDVIGARDTGMRSVLITHDNSDVPVVPDHHVTGDVRNLIDLVLTLLED